MKTRSVISAIGWLLSGILLFLWQDKYLPFHYEYMEQFRLFHGSAESFIEHGSYPSGLIEYMASFLIQFFNQPFPARSAVAVKDLPKGALVEIEVLAVK